MFQKRLREVGVVVQVGERDFRLDHPELGQVAAGVGVLGAERRAEGVDLRQREAVGLDVELAGNREEGFPAEEVLRIVHAPGRFSGGLQDPAWRPEQRARAFRIRRGDDRRVHPEEAALVEEAVDRLRERVAHARGGGDHVGARPQVRDLAQEFERVRLGLDRIGVRVVDPADDLQRRGLHLERLALAGEGTMPVASIAQPAVRCSTLVVRQVPGRHHLDRVERGAVGEMDEREAGLGIAPRAHPAFQRDRGVLRRAPGENVGAGSHNGDDMKLRRSILFVHRHLPLARPKAFSEACARRRASSCTSSPPAWATGTSGSRPTSARSTTPAIAATT